MPTLLLIFRPVRKIKHAYTRVIYIDKVRRRINTDIDLKTPEAHYRRRFISRAYSPNQFETKTNPTKATQKHFIQMQTWQNWRFMYSKIHQNAHGLSSYNHGSIARNFLNTLTTKHPPPAKKWESVSQLRHVTLRSDLTVIIASMRTTEPCRGVLALKG